MSNLLNFEHQQPYIYNVNKQRLIEILRAEKTYLSHQFGVQEIALFGSFARAENAGESDVDILVTLQKPSFSSLIDLKDYLESKFHTKVDLVRNGPHLSEQFKNLIKDDLVYA